MFSDKLLAELVKNRSIYESFQTFKGLFYIVFTTVCLYFVVRIDNYKIFRLSEKIIAKNNDLVSFSEEVIAMDDELIGENWTELLIHKDDKDGMFSLIKELKKVHKVKNFKLNTMKSDGSILNI